MSKYIIRVECLEDNEKLDAELAAGIEAKGFCILAETEERYLVSVDGLSVDGIANIITRDQNVLAAAILAKAKKEAAQLLKGEEMHERVKEASAGIVEMMGEFIAKLGETNVD